MKDVCIIGGGIAGLSLASFLKKKRPDCTIAIIEKEARAGGWIQTHRSSSGQLYETGPRSLRIFGRSGRSLEQLLNNLELTDQLVPLSSASSSRYFFSKEGLVAVPKSFGAACISPFGRTMMWNVLRDAFSKTQLTDSDMSVEKYMTSFFPSEQVREAVEALVFGIWGCRASKLSARFAFRDLYPATCRHKSFVRGCCSLVRLTGLKKRGLWSFREGLQTLIQAIEKEQSANLFLQEEALSVESAEKAIHIHTTNQSFVAKKVVFALPHHALQKVAPHAIQQKMVSSLPHSSIAVVAFGWKEKIPYLKGFGALASLQAEREVLGSIFDSSSFDFQNSSMNVRLTVMLGGGKVEDILSYGQERLISLARDFLRRRFAITAPSDETHLFYAKDALLAPPPGCFSREQKPYIKSSCERMAVLSSYYAGVGIASMVEAAEKLALDIANC